MISKGIKVHIVGSIRDGFFGGTFDIFNRLFGETPRHRHLLRTSYLLTLPYDSHLLQDFIDTPSAKFIECSEIPYTHTLKRVEVAVKKLVNGTPLGKINTSAISNPETLAFFVDHPQLRDINMEKSKL